MMTGFDSDEQKWWERRWVESKGHLLLLACFQEPQSANALPALPASDWDVLLGEPVDVAVETFLRQGALGFVRTATVLSGDQFSKEELTDLARERSLPTSGTKADLAHRLVKSDEAGMRALVAPLKIYRLTAFGARLVEENLQLDAEDVQRSPQREKLVKVLKWLAEQSGAGIVGTIATGIAAFLGHMAWDVLKAILEADELPSRPAPEPIPAPEPPRTPEPARTPDLPGTRRGRQQTYQDMEFCLVPAGPFWMGSPDNDPYARDNEKPLQRINVGYDYWISRYPVTVDQFRQFLRTSGYSFAHLAQQSAGDHPARYVKWDDAVAYCNWLQNQARWGRSRLRIALPSEAEWEKAARGGIDLLDQAVVRRWGQSLNVAAQLTRANVLPQRRYPWGDEPRADLANTEEAGRKGTVSVFQHLDGASPYGVVDLVGNVWEWTRSIYQDRYRYSREELPPEDWSIRTAKGGNFFWSQTSLSRCACRWNNPYDWYLVRGFRVVASPFS